MSPSNLRILFIEDRPEDALLLVRSLERSGFPIHHQIVESFPAFAEALRKDSWDVIVCDYVLPSFSFQAALAHLHEQELDLPFIVVSGMVGEEFAVEAMRAGAHDFLSKNKLGRLAPVIEREMREVKLRRERKEFEESLRLNHFSIEKMREALLWVDQNGAIFYANEAACRLYSLSYGQMVKSRFPEMHHAPNRDNWPRFWEELKKRGASRGESQFRSQDRGQLILELLANYLEFKDREFAVMFVRDITERKQREEQLQYQARLLDLAHDAIIVRDLEDRVISWNKGAERLYGWSAPQAIGRKVTELIYRDLRPYEQAKNDVLSGANEWKGELRQYSRDGAELVVSSRWTVLRDDRGQPQSVLVINTDITDKKKLEEKFLHSQRMESLGTLASGIAHDLNNILTPVILSAQFLKAKATGPELQKAVATVESSARRGASVVKQLLTFARGIEGERVLIDPSQLIAEIKKMMDEIFPKSISYQLEVPSGLWPILGDATQLHQVLLNLCVNARDAMPSGGRLTISARNTRLDETYASMMQEGRPGDYVVLKVADTGVGIAAEHLPKIFEPFFTTKEPTQGSGLGLSTVLGIAKSHGGFVRVQSETGRGSTFEVYLPASTEQTVVLREEATVTAPRGNGELILVVDDEVNIREAAQKILTQHGYEVMLAADGAEAVGLYAHQREAIRLVIVDLMMPVLDGVALIRALQKIEPEVKAIVCSGIGHELKIAELMTLGITHYLDKPFNADALIRVVHECLSGKPA
jgi:PAS domain S-box-containing protein